MKSRTILLSLSVIILVALTGCDSSKPKTTSSQSVESLTIGTPHPLDRSALIWVAEHQGYFAEHGLNINTKTYDSGLTATKDLLAGKLDLAVATDFVAARHILDRTDLRIVCSIGEVDAEALKVVARKDHGITQVSDIRHKRIGLLRGSASDFVLDLLLVLQNIPFQEVERVYLSPSDQVKAISKGDVDAVVLWEPFITRASHELGANALIWPTQTVHNYYFLLLGSAKGVRKRAHAIRQLVASLVSAEEFIKIQRDESKQIVARKLESNHIESVWTGFKITVGLDDSLALMMKAQMRWMRPDTQTKDPAALDILPYIYFDALKSVQPEKIKILH
jgi:NitT/TauT family transport system substrate-binding protein